MKKFNHFFITIFNVKRPKPFFKSVWRKLHSQLTRKEFILNGQKVLNNPETPIRLNEDYLETRFKLFEKFCFPSVVGQSNQNFKWLVFLDSQTPDSCKEKIEKYSEYSNLVPIYVEEFNSTTLRNAITNNLTDNPEYLITTNLDNDDAISRDYVKLVQKEFNEQNFAVVTFPHGYVWKEPSGKLYLREYLSNPFISLIESAKDFKTVYYIPHQDYVPKYAKAGLIKPIKANPGWMQVIHGSNLRNRIEGMRKPRKKLFDNFSVNIEKSFIEEDENRLFIGLELPLNYCQSITLKMIRGVREKLEQIDQERAKSLKK